MLCRSAVVLKDTIDEDLEPNVDFGAGLAVRCRRPRAAVTAADRPGWGFEHAVPAWLPQLEIFAACSDFGLTSGDRDWSGLEPRLEAVELRFRDGEPGLEPCMQLVGDTGASLPGKLGKRRELRLAFFGDADPGDVVPKDNLDVSLDIDCGAGLVASCGRPWATLAADRPGVTSEDAARERAPDLGTLEACSDSGLTCAATGP